MVGLLSLGSLVFGLLAWILPILALRKLGHKSMVYVAISFAFVALSILFQLMSQEYFADIEDLSAIMDTIGFAITMSWVLFIVAILFNSVVIYRYVQEAQGKRNILEKINTWILLIALVPFLVWVLGYFLIEPITWQTTLFGILFLLMVISASFMTHSSTLISLLVLMVLSVVIYFVGLNESIARSFYHNLLVLFFGYYLILNLINYTQYRQTKKLHSTD